MSISAIVVTTALMGALALFILAGVVLAVVDKRLDPARVH